MVWLGCLSVTLAWLLTQAFLLTHGLVSGGYCGGVMENQDLGLKLPGCLWAQLRGNHHHALPDG